MDTAATTKKPWSRKVKLTFGAGLLGSVLVATGAVYLVRRSRGGTITR